MDPIILKAALVKFSDLGVEPAVIEKDLPVTDKELGLIGNYYSIILGVAEDQGGLYGPLPVSYHYDTLLFLYAFHLIDRTVKDKRIIAQGYKVPTALLFFFPLALDATVSRYRSLINNQIKIWEKEFEEVQQVTEAALNNLTGELIKKILIEEEKLQTDDKRDIIKVVGKTLAFLNTVSGSLNQQISILAIGRSEIISGIFKRALLQENWNIVKTYEAKENMIKISTIGGLKINIWGLDGEPLPLAPSNLDGVIYFGNFSTDDLIKKHNANLIKILKSIPESCALSISMSLDEGKLAGKKTPVGEVLLSPQASGRSIAMIDLTDPKNTLETVIINHVETVISKINC